MFSLEFWSEVASALPRDRAYELVSPPDTGAVTPIAAAMGQTDGVDCFETQLATADGERVTFNSDMGALEGFAANGVLNLYESFRTETGWVTESKSANGQQSTYPAGGLCLSPDHQYSTLLTGGAPFDRGSLAIGGNQTSYVRTPTGAYLLVGAGSIGTDQRANIKWIADGGAHIILTAQKRLEPEAPLGIGSGSSYDGSNPVNAVYDRTPEGLAVVSLLPNGSAPNSATETTFYRGVSADGGSVAFDVSSGAGTTLYVHRNDGLTVPVVTGSHRFAGISADGRRVVYLVNGSGGDPDRGSIYVYDTASQLTVPVTTGTEAAVVNVSHDGSHVYFTTPDALPSAVQNPLGKSPAAGSPNLYGWDVATGAIRFIATVVPADVEEIDSSHENLAEWVRTVAAPQQNALVGRVNDPSRTTPDGSVFLFQSRGDVTGYDSGGRIEIYRFDEIANELSCVSCPADGVPAVSDAFLQQGAIGPTMGLNALARLANVTDDGRIVFFMTADPLLTEDVNGSYDVYEWRQGALSLISSGKSPSPSLLYAMSADGKDVFFLTTDRLVPQDESSVLSIYDARIGGGFPGPVSKPSCEGSSCQGPPGRVPGAPALGSELVTGSGQAHPCKRCKPCRKAKRRKRCKRRKHRAKQQQRRIEVNR